MSDPLSAGVRGRALLAVLLVASAALLFLLNLASEKIDRHKEIMAGRPDAVVARIDTAMASLLRGFHVDLRTARSRPIRSQGRQQIREELHVTVPPEFVSLEFNRTLGRVMEQFGAHVIATERSREGKVLLHIMYRGTIIRTLVLTFEP